MFDLEDDEEMGGFIYMGKLFFDNDDVLKYFKDDFEEDVGLGDEFEGL